MKSFTLYNKLLKLFYAHGYSKLFCCCLLLLCLQSGAQNKLNYSVSGAVSDSNNVPLSGVSVKVKGGMQGTSTDAEGKFSLSFTANKNPLLIVSYVGFETKEIPVANSQTLNIILKQEGGTLGDVVIVGYGKQKKATVTAAISSVDGDALVKAPVANISNSLGGRVSGIISRQSTGEPGEDNDRIQIRGIGTTGSSDPLVIVNGIPRPYSQLDPNDIETVTVLKDAAAVAPYGLAGANGVILVTTKRGKEGKFSLNYDGFYGFQKPTNMPEFLNAYDYARLLSEANVNIGNAPTYTEEQLQKFKDGSDPDHYPNTDWVHEVLSNDAPITRHSLSFSGGSQKIRIYSNIGYLYQEGVVPVVKFNRYNLTSSIDANVTATTTMSLDIQGMFSKQKNPGGNDGTAIFTNVTEYPPILPIRFSDGKAANALLPQIYESGYDNLMNNMFNAKLQIEQKLPFIQGLSLKGAFAYNKYYTFQKAWQLPVRFYSLNGNNEYVTQSAGPVNPTLTETFNEIQNIIVQGYITYDRTFGKHSIGALAVVETQKGLTNTFNASRINYSVPLDELSSGSSNKNDFNNGGASGQSAQTGLVYRVNYTYATKYLVELSGRYDGHYYFAPSERYAFFPAASLGWRLSEENFIKDNITWINNLKIRGSYGKSGNLAGGPFQYLPSYGLRNSYVFGGTSPVQVQGIYENTQANPNITWETANKADIGLDASLFRNKLTFSLDIFKERRSDMLIAPQAALPAEYGISISQVNAGIMENRGLDFSISTDQIFKNGMRLNAAFNFTYAQNKLIQTFESASTYNNSNRRQTGRPYNAQFGLEALGLYQVDDFDADGNLKQGLPVPSFGAVKPGDIKYADIAGTPGADGKPTAPDGKIDINDYNLIGDPLFPQIIYGLNLNFSWKGFDVSALLQGAAKASIYLSNEMAFPFFNGAKIFKQQADFWTPENTNAAYPRLTPTPTTNNTQPSSFWIKSGNYLRLKTAQVGYSLPASVLNNMHIASLRVYVSGQNLFTISKLKFLDPELGNARARYYFQQRVLSFGLNVGF